MAGGVHCQQTAPYRTAVSPRARLAMRRAAVSVSRHTGGYGTRHGDTDRRHESYAQTSVWTSLHHGLHQATREWECGVANVCTFPFSDFTADG